MKHIKGGVCAIGGVSAGGTKHGKNGLAIIIAKGNAAGVFTKSKITSAPVIITKKRITDKKKLSAVIVNSGNANAFTGEEGIQDANKMAEILSKHTGISQELIAVASTGIIGKRMDINSISKHAEEVLKNISNETDASTAAANAIMTTDTTQKELAIELESGVRIGGIAKGSGMIEPNMGTMLAFIYTDADIGGQSLDTFLREAVNKSFNMIVVDGDTSTNDTVLITATGNSKYKTNADEFQAGLDYLLTKLAKKIARDGEGATKLIEVQVKAAKTTDDARKVAKTVVRSPLVKSAMFGNDPNWGRVVAAIGYSGMEVDQELISISFANPGKKEDIVEKGKIICEKTTQIENLGKIMAEKEITIIIDLGMGEKAATAWGCDLTPDYVYINSKYTT
jgi:glutamate N-acetyltransferase/amino-acid N-acetyltransferase